MCNLSCANLLVTARRYFFTSSLHFASLLPDVTRPLHVSLRLPVHGENCLPLTGPSSFFHMSMGPVPRLPRSSGSSPQRTRTRFPLLMRFEDHLDDALSDYKRLPAIPDHKGHLPGQKRPPKKKYVHLPPLDPLRFPTLANAETNGLALDPTSKFKMKVHDDNENDEGRSVSERLAAALRQASARVLDLFRQWDTDGDGEVSRTEFIRAFEQIGRGLMLGLEVEKSQIGALFDEWDEDGGGSISFGELEKILKRRRSPPRPRRGPRGRTGPRLCYTHDAPPEPPPEPAEEAQNDAVVSEEQIEVAQVPYRLEPVAAANPAPAAPEPAPAPAP